MNLSTKIVVFAGLLGIGLAVAVYSHLQDNENTVSVSVVNEVEDENKSALTVQVDGQEGNDFQSPPNRAPQPTTLKDGVFTKAQAEKGKTSYENNCKACHTPDFYKEKLMGWNQAPLIEFYYLISDTMPQDRPGALSPQEYTDALAHIFSLLGYPAGEKVLNADDGSMDEILIVTD